MVGFSGRKPCPQPTRLPFGSVSETLHGADRLVGHASSIRRAVGEVDARCGVEKIGSLMHPNMNMEAVSIFISGIKLLSCDNDPKTIPRRRRVFCLWVLFSMLVTKRDTDKKRAREREREREREQGKERQRKRKRQRERGRKRDEKEREVAPKW